MIKGPTFLLGEVARIAQVKRETLRMWDRRGYLDLGDASSGWRRFSLEETLAIGTYAAIMRISKDHEIAGRIKEVVGDYAAQCLDGVVGERLWSIVHRTESGEIDETLIDDEEEAFRFFRELMTGQTLEDCRGASMIDIAGLYRDLAARIMKVVEARKDGSFAELTKALQPLGVISEDFSSIVGDTLRPAQEAVRQLSKDVGTILRSGQDSK